METVVSDKVNKFSSPSDLRITDIRTAHITGSPKNCILLKIMTNQGIIGFGEIRDASSKTYALMLKSRLIGENPCNVDKIFRKIKQFGGHSRQGGGVSGVEIALWDLAGKAWNVPLWQMLGGKFRDKVRVYGDTDVSGKHSGHDMGLALKKRMDMGFTLLKMDLGIGLLLEEPGTLNAPLGFIDEMKTYASHILNVQSGSVNVEMVRRQKSYDIVTTAHPFTGIHITEKGLDCLEEYIKNARSIAGYDIPIAIDHFGHVCVEDCIRFLRRVEKYNIAWAEDMVPWIYSDQMRRLKNSTAIPICTGEDIYLKEGFQNLIENDAVSVIHPDILTCGGALELKKIADYADEHGVAVAVHMAESPIACMAAVHTAAAMHNNIAVEFHSVDVPWWGDIATGLPKPLIQDGFITIPNKPGLGIDELCDDVIREHINPADSGLWESTDIWNNEFSNDRTWS
ncbi:MAG: mandelate racemase [Clostridiales bacterium GWF2_36_10]|nr:MAG: mandelate racemase [Clostridiales bacterium GWF2_36_10]HAN20482.1 mandelate racemase/muconate lactonizing enzyme family protein [Clostridiales bacterium]